MARLTTVRFRFVITVVTLLAGVAAPSASAYGWPVRPFNKPHPIRGGFGDPRTVFSLGFLADPWSGPGSFSFHNGIDISAPGNTPVYPVTSGIAHVGVSAEIDVESPRPNGTRRTFHYEHLLPNVYDGEKVVARKTILGRVQPSAGHVHLTEIVGIQVTNPLLKGHLAPYKDNTRPQVALVELKRPATDAEVGTLGICGRVAISAEAYDRPALPVPKPWNGLPIAPATVSWKLTKLDGTLIVPLTTVANFRTTVPGNGQFWTVYARGTYQNAPRFGTQQFGAMPGRFLYQLTPMLDTRTLPNGVALLTVVATDERQNVGALTERLSIYNNPHVIQCPDSQETTTTTTG
jgi:hypothetical protein